MENSGIMPVIRQMAKSSESKLFTTFFFIFRTMPQAWCPSGDAPAASPKGLKVFTFKLPPIYCRIIIKTHNVYDSFASPKMAKPQYIVPLPSPICQPEAALYRHYMKQAPIRRMRACLITYFSVFFVYCPIPRIVKSVSSLMSVFPPRTAMLFALFAFSRTYSSAIGIFFAAFCVRINGPL